MTLSFLDARFVAWRADNLAPPSHVQTTAGLVLFDDEGVKEKRSANNFCHGRGVRCTLDEIKPLRQPFRQRIVNLLSVAGFGVRQ
jgi:hypothetical protein